MCRLSEFKRCVPSPLTPLHVRYVHLGLTQSFVTKIARRFVTERMIIDTALITSKKTGPTIKGSGAGINKGIAQRKRPETKSMCCRVYPLGYRVRGFADEAIKHSEYRRRWIPVLSAINFCRTSKHRFSKAAQ